MSQVCDCKLSPTAILVWPSWQTHCAIWRKMLCYLHTKRTKYLQNENTSKNFKSHACQFVIYTLQIDLHKIAIHVIWRRATSFLTFMFAIKFNPQCTIFGACFWSYSNETSKYNWLQRLSDDGTDVIVRVKFLWERDNL